MQAGEGDRQGLDVKLTPEHEQALAAMEPTDEERAWAIHEAQVVDPGTDDPASKLRQRRVQERIAREQRERDKLGEPPLAKFVRVFGETGEAHLASDPELHAKVVSGDHSAKSTAALAEPQPMESRAGIVPPRRPRFPHSYPGAPGHNPTDPGDCFTSDCAHGCGCYAGPSTSGGPEGMDPFGECPSHPDRVSFRTASYADTPEGRAAAKRINEAGGHATVHVEHVHAPRYEVFVTTENGNVPVGSLTNENDAIRLRDAAPDRFVWDRERRGIL